MTATRSIINSMQRYSRLEKFGKEYSYQLHTKIMQSNNCILSRLMASTIPISCSISLVSKILSDICRAGDTIAQSIWYREYAGGNIQTLAIDVAEYARHLMGIVFGLPAAILSPQAAADAFLTKPATLANTFLKPDEGARLYAMADLLHKFFVKHKIDYRICSGTALGAKREGGIIRNDDDIDLMLHPNSAEIFKDLVNNGTFAKETGINILAQPWTGGWQSFYGDSPKGARGSPLEHIGKPFVDIFPGVWRKNGKGNVISYGEDTMYYQSKGDYFTKDEWSEPPQLYNFGPTKLFGIKSIDNYIERSYGPLALEYITLLYPHNVYSRIYAHPTSIFSIASEYPTPRYLRHTQKAPLDYNQKDYHAKTSRWSGEAAQEDKPSTLRMSG